MSIRVMSAVWGLDLPDSEMLVLLALADWSNDDGHCWPSIAQLVKKTRKSERTIQGAIKLLVAKGHMSREERRGQGCNYVIHPRSDCTPADTAPRKDRTPANSAPPQPLPPTPAAAADNTSRHTITSQKTTSSSRTRADKPRFTVPDDIPADAWAGFEQMRKTIRKPLTDHGRSLAVQRLRALRKDGHDPTAVLNHSILNNYQGLFPPKDDSHGHAQRNSGGSRSPSGHGTTVDAAYDFLADHGYPRH